MGATRVRALIGRLTRTSAIRYLVIGATSFLIDFGLLWLLHDVLHVVLWLATGTAFLASFFFNYFLQRWFSFRSRGSHPRSVVKYAILVGFNTLATVGIVDAAAALGFEWEIGKVASTVATTIWNYFAYRFIVFVDRPFASTAFEEIAEATSLAVPEQQPITEEED
jgi:putative flippase GtrA